MTIAIAAGVGCSSSSSSNASCTDGQEVPCTCAGGQTGTAPCGSNQCSCDGADGGGNVDATTDAPAIDTPGDATHLDEKPPPSVGYAECAVKGSFGWPCKADASGPDPVDCTDPSFPDCFVGGQGAWCTVSCAQFGVCPGGDQDGGDAGCVPVSCNARGWCK